MRNMSTAQNQMEEFQESDILWPECKEDQKEDITKPDECCKPSRPQQGTSAPILIPSKGPFSHSWTAGFNYGRNGIYINDDDHDDDGDDYNGSGTDTDVPSDSVVPPHILISRRYTDKMPFSVCVGNGRKLKGREQRAARILVLRLTGYVEK